MNDGEFPHPECPQVPPQGLGTSGTSGVRESFPKHQTLHHTFPGPKETDTNQMNQMESKELTLKSLKYMYAMSMYINVHKLTVEL